MANPIVWLDLETTGLNTEDDLILEIGLVATDDQLNRFDGVPDFSTIILPTHGLDITRLNPYVVEMHSKNGIFAEIAAAKGVTLERATKDLKTWLNHVVRVYYNNLSPDFVGETNLDYSDVRLLMAGSTVGQFDRQFFARDFPDAMDSFEYRVIDVSSFKEVVRRLYGDEATYSDEDAAKDGVGKEHRAIPDIEASIAELRFYINSYFQPKIQN